MNAGARSRATATLTLLLAGFTGACAHVGEDQFNTELESLRRQIEEGDRASQESVSALGQRTDQRMADLVARLDGLAEGLRELQSEFDVTVERLTDAIRFDMPVYFAFDDATLRPEDHPVLDRFSSVVQEFYPEALLTVEGFTDPSGSVEYNRNLGMRRAGAVREYLVESGGLPESRLRMVSYGEDEDRLVAPDRAGRDEGWENRRVAVVIEHLGAVDGTAGIAASTTFAVP